MSTAMNRLKQQFTDLKNAIGTSYKVFELNGKDEQSSSNENGYTKAIVSDFIRVYNSIDKSYSFSFAFNNNERDDLGGIIVSTQVNKDRYLRAYLSFEEFKPLMNKLVKEIKVLVNTQDKMDYKKVNDLIKENFNLKCDVLNLDSFVDHLVISLKPTEEEFKAVVRTISSCKEQIAKSKNILSKEEFKSHQKDILEVINCSTEQLSRIEDFYRQLIQMNKEQLMKDKPYVSSRLLCRMIEKKLNEYQTETSLKKILLNELDAKTGYASCKSSELYSD